MKKLEGTFRQDRAARGEMAPPKAAPKRPSWLKGEARKEWDRVVPQLAELGVLSDVDGAMLADYCAAHDLAVTATQKYKRQGLMLKGPYGPMKNPLIKVAQEARAQARLLADEFGLSSASRSRISVPEKPKDEDKDESFLFGGPPKLVPVTGGK